MDDFPGWPCHWQWRLPANCRSVYLATGTSDAITLEEGARRYYVKEMSEHDLARVTAIVATNMHSPESLARKLVKAGLRFQEPPTDPPCIERYVTHLVTQTNNGSRPWARRVALAWHEDGNCTCALHKVVGEWQHLHETYATPMALARARELNLYTRTQEARR